MSYYDDRGYGDYGRDRGYAADYYEGYSNDRRYDTHRDYSSRQSRRPTYGNRRRASSVGGEPVYAPEYRSQRNSSRPYEYEGFCHLPIILKKLC